MEFGFVFEKLYLELAPVFPVQVIVSPTAKTVPLVLFAVQLVPEILHAMWVGFGAEIEAPAVIFVLLFVEVVVPIAL